MTREVFYQNKLFVGLCNSNEKSVSQISLKLVEELGEVTEEIMIEQNSILEGILDLPQVSLKLEEEFIEDEEEIAVEQSNAIEEIVDFQMVAESLIVKINGDRVTTRKVSGNILNLVVGVGLVSESALSEMNASGMSYKNQDSSELENAVLNVIHISESMFKQLGGTEDMKRSILQEKCEKWAKVTNYTN